MIFSNLINATYHPNIFQNQTSEDSLLKSVDGEIFTRTKETLESDRSKLLKGPTPKQQLIYDESCKKNNTCQKLKLEKNITNKLFFSSDNIQILQDMIRYTVHKHSNFVIGNQSETELLIVMRSIYFQYSNNPIITNLQTQKKQIRAEIDRLNKIVVNQIVPDVISETQQYIDYLRDIETPAIGPDMPSNPSVKGTKNLRDISEILRT